jgi:histone H3/H4
MSNIALPLAPVVRIAKSVTVPSTRISSDAASVFVAKAEAYIKSLATESEKLAIHRGAKTITTEDIDLALDKF